MRGWRQLVFRESLGNRCQQRMHPQLHRSPLGPISGEIALVHGQRHRCQIDLPYEARHSRHLDRVRMSEELATSDQPAELVTTKTWYVIDAAAFRLCETVPTPDGRACGADCESVLLPEVDRKRLDSGAIDRYLQVGSHDQRTIGITQSDAQAAGIESFIDTIDSDAHVPLLQRNALDYHLELVSLELGAVAVIRVGKSPRRFVSRSARLDGEARPQMADRSFAALTVLAEQVAAALGRITQARPQPARPVRSRRQSCDRPSGHELHRRGEPTG